MVTTEASERCHGTGHLKSPSACPDPSKDKLASQLNRSVDGVPYQVDALHEEEGLVQLVVDRQASLCACSPGPS